MESQMNFSPEDEQTFKNLERYINITKDYMRKVQEIPDTDLHVDIKGLGAKTLFLSTILETLYNLQKEKEREEKLNRITEEKRREEELERKEEREQEDVFQLPRAEMNEVYYPLPSRGIVSPRYIEEIEEDGHRLDDEYHKYGSYFLNKSHLLQASQYISVWLHLYQFALLSDWEGKLPGDTLYFISTDTGDPIETRDRYTTEDRGSIQGYHYFPKTGAILFPTEYDCRKAWRSLTPEQRKIYLGLNTRPDHMSTEFNPL